MPPTPFDHFFASALAFVAGTLCATCLIKYIERLEQEASHA